MILVYALYRLTGARLVVHVLDNFIDTAKYRRFAGLPRRLAIFMMRRADHLLTISPAMREAFASRYGLSSRTAFRWYPVDARQVPSIGNGKILFGGAINEKTNLEALTEFAGSLAQCQETQHLEVYARGGNSELKNLPKVTLKPAVDEDTFVNLAGAYDAFLVPFNSSQDSLAFYRESCPSKASALFAAQIPILIFGPREFWFLRFLESYNFTASSLDQLAACRLVPAEEYIRANETLRSLCEVHSLAVL